MGIFIKPLLLITDGLFEVAILRLANKEVGMFDDIIEFELQEAKKHFSGIKWHDPLEMETLESFYERFLDAKDDSLLEDFKKEIEELKGDSLEKEKKEIAYRVMVETQAEIIEDLKRRLSLYRILAFLLENSFRSLARKDACSAEERTLH